MENEYMHVIINLILVLFVMFVAMFFLRKFKWNKGAWSQHIKMINAISIGPKEKIMLIEVNNMFLLLGATPNHIETLYVFDELKQELAPSEETARIKKNFKELFKKV